MLSNPQVDRKMMTVDQYISEAPPEVQPKLTQLRQIIIETVPDAVEKISYSMPYYGYKGRLVYFAYAKDHIGLYIPPPVIAEHASELQAYGTATATVRFPLTNELPIALIKKLILARVVKNEGVGA